MPTIEEARQEVEQAEQNITTVKSQLEAEKKKADVYEQQVKSIETPARDINFQQKYIRRYPRVFSGKTESIIAVRRATKEQGLKTVKEARQKISQYETDVLAPYEQQVETAKKEISSYEAEQAEWQQAEILAGRDLGIWFASAPQSLKQKVFAIAEGYKRTPSKEYVDKLKGLGLKPVWKSDEEGGFKIGSFVDTKLGKSYPVEFLPDVLKTERKSDIPEFESAGIITTVPEPGIVTQESFDILQPVTTQSLVPIKQELVQIGEVNGVPVFNKPIARTVQTAEPKDFLQKLSDKSPVLAGVATPFYQIGKLGKDIITNPVETGKNIGLGLGTFTKKTTLFFLGTGKSPFADIGPSLRTEKGLDYAFGRLVGEGALAYGTALAAPPIENLAIKGATKLSPKFRPVIESAEGSRIIEDIPSAVKGRGTIEIPIQERLPTMSLSEQAKVAGTSQDLVSGARDLFGFAKSERNIAKPIPGEELLSANTKQKLGSFDAGDLPSAEIPELNRAIIKETGSKGLLERSFFADPLGRLRPSRLGIEQTETAKISDILSGDFSFRRSKPQAILLENQKIAEFPSGLKDVESSLLKGKALTSSQQDRLLRWQLNNERGFKPVGFYSGEAEVITSKGILKSRGKAALTIINGRRVPIIRAEIGSVGEGTKDLISKASSGKLSNAELRLLSKKLRRETGIDYSSSILGEKPYLSPSSPSTLLLSKSPKSKGASSISVNEVSSDILSGKSSSSNIIGSKSLSSLSKSQPYQSSGISRGSRYPIGKSVGSISPYSPKTYKSIAKPSYSERPYPRLKVLSDYSLRNKGKGKKKKIRSDLSEEFKKIREIRYTPSFAATTLGITSSKVPLTVGGKNTYFAGFRPVITKKKQNRKVYKKKKVKK